MIKVTLNNTNTVEINEGTSVLDVVKSINEKSANMAICAEVNGKIRDLRYSIKEEGSLNLLTYENSLEGKKVYWHTTAHIMAQAVQRLFPNAKFGREEITDEGFCYEFDIDKPFNNEEKLKIEQEMRVIIKENIPIEKFELSKKEALELMRNQPYKKELIRELKIEQGISFYKQGDFIDLCNGPHLMNTGVIRETKIFSSSEVFWGNNEKGKKLQRLCGISFS